MSHCTKTKVSAFSVLQHGVPRGTSPIGRNFPTFKIRAMAGYSTERRTNTSNRKIILLLFFNRMRSILYRKSWENSQVEPGTMSKLNLYNTVYVPAIGGKTKLGQFPAIAEKKPCYSRDLRWEYISLL